MESALYHLQINVDVSNKEFYNGLFKLLNWSDLYSDDSMFSFRSSNNVDLWFIDTEAPDAQIYDDKGVNHISIKVNQQSNVDEIVEYLKIKNIPSLFETPKHRPEFAGSESETYYQIMFESPDKVLFEVVYVGAKS